MAGPSCFGVEQADGVNGHDHPGPRSGGRCGEAAVGRVHLLVGPRSRSVEVDFVSLRARCALGERHDGLASNERLQILVGELHDSPVNQRAAATRMASPASSEARIKYLVCTQRIVMIAGVPARGRR